MSYTETNGVLNGANYTIRIPNPIGNWNGMLVMLCRGYSLSADLTTGAPVTVLPAAIPSTGSVATIAPSLIAEGYAIAASNYGAVGMSIQKGINSTYDLTQFVIKNFNVKGKVFLIGQSMGGAIALLLGQKYPNVYSGVLDEAGTKNLTSIYTGSSIMATQNDSDLAAYLQSINAVVVPYPVSASVSSLPLSVKLQVWRSFCRQATTDIANETGGTPTAVPQAYAMNSPVLNANISIPVITVHGTKDGLVPYSQSLSYQTAVAAAGKSSLYRLYTMEGAEHVDAQVIAQTIPRFTELVYWSNAQDEWTMTVDGRSMKAYPDLKETVWQKNATMPPNGQYDKIGLHRLVKMGIAPKGVVFLTNCPNWGAGEERISNPPTDNYTKYENFSQAIYWANRGFDVYAIDYRTHFVPTAMDPSQMSFTKDWGLDVWMSDIKEAAEKVKDVSGNSKFFISGECTGGAMALNYAARYWKTDLKGIILLDINTLSAAPVVGKPTETNSYNATKAVNDLALNGNWTADSFRALRPILPYVMQNPGAPAVNPLTNQSITPATNPLTNKTWTNITEWVAYSLQTLGGINGMFYNIVGGYSDINVDEYNALNSWFLPWRVRIDTVAMMDWNNCPYISYDYNDHYNEIGVPVLSFNAELFANRTGAFRYVNGINNTDFTGVMLKSYGHTDVFYGTYSARDVSEPAYRWMLGHLSTLDVTARTSVTVLPGWTWWFFAQNLGGSGPYTYQWYEGLNPIQGQTSMVFPATKTAPGVYSFFCRVTDKDGTTTTSNAVTLTVIG